MVNKKGTVLKSLPQDAINLSSIYRNLGRTLYWTKVSKTAKWGKFSGKGFKYSVLYLMEKRCRCLQGTEVENH